MENGKRVLVTGASGGIGFAIVQAALSAGYQVTAHYNSHADSLKNLAEQNKENLHLLQFNVTDRENCKFVLEKDRITELFFLRVFAEMPHSPP